MKKFLIFIALLVFIALIASGLFLATADLNRFIPLMKEQAEKSLQSKVEFKTASVTLAEGLSINIDKLNITSETASTAPAESLSADEASIHFDLLPILMGRFQVGSIDVVRPKATIIKNKSGRILIAGIGAMNSQNQETKQGGPSALPLTLLISELKAADGELIYRDDSIAPPQIIPLSGIMIKIKNFSWNHPAQLQAKANLFGIEGNNLDLSAQVSLPSGNTPARIRNIAFRADLNNVAWEKVKKALPASQALLEKQNPQGVLEAAFQELNIDNGKIRDISGSVKLKNASLVIPESESPLTEINTDANLNQAYIQIPQATFKFADGNGFFSANIQDWIKKPVVTFEGNLRQINLAKIFPHRLSETYLEGFASIKLKTNFQTTSAGQLLSDTVQGEGEVTVDKPVIANLNILRETLGRISVIPGINERLQQKLPDETKEKLNRPDTALSDIRQVFYIKSGVATIDQIQIASDSLEMQGSARYQLTDHLEMQGVMRISPDVSQVMIRSINELSYLNDSDGKIQIPLKISGPFSKLGFYPDLNYIASKIAVVKAQELISGFLDKKRPDQNTAVPAEQPGTGPTPAPATTEPPSAPKKVKFPKASQLAELLLTQPSSKAAPQADETPPPVSDSQGSILDQLLSAAMQSKKQQSPS